MSEDEEEKECIKIDNIDKQLQLQALASTADDSDDTLEDTDNYRECLEDEATTRNKSGGKPTRKAKFLAKKSEFHKTKPSLNQQSKGISKEFQASASKLKVIGEHSFYRDQSGFYNVKKKGTIESKKSITESEEEIFESVPLHKVVTYKPVRNEMLDEAFKDYPEINSIPIEMDVEFGIQEKGKSSVLYTGS